MFLDIGAGIFTALFLSKINSVELNWFFVVAGIIFALLPDADYVFLSFKKKDLNKSFLHHREMLHHPLLYIPIGTIIVYFFSPIYAELFFLASLAHFIHDSIGVGWGVQWLYPFNKNHYSFLYLYKPSFNAKKLPTKLFYAFKHEEIDALDRDYGDPNWVKNIYFKLHPYGIFEIVVFIVSLIVLYFYI